MIARLRHIQKRRADLRRDIDVVGTFEKWEETCVPSYCHGNWLAAYISWTRLFRASDLGRAFAPHASRILDFGSSVGELGHIVSKGGEGYDFIEGEDHAAKYLVSRLPLAKRVSLDEAKNHSYDLVYAIDSLEHNNNYSDLLNVLSAKLRCDGALILSGPTENQLYRLGRRIAGFDGHYHEATIYDIERAAAQFLRRQAVRSIMPIAPLFRISAWTK